MRRLTGYMALIALAVTASTCATTDNTNITRAARSRRRQLLQSPSEECTLTSLSAMRAYLKSLSVGCRLFTIERGVGHLPLMVR